MDQNIISAFHSNDRYWPRDLLRLLVFLGWAYGEVNKLLNYVFMSYDPFVCDNSIRKSIIRGDNKYAPLKCTVVGDTRQINFGQGKTGEGAVLVWSVSQPT